MSRSRLSRRRAVQLSGSLLVAGLAGCPADPNGAGTATPESAETVETDAGTPGDGDGTSEFEAPATGTPADDSPTRTRTRASSGGVTPAVSVSDQETDGGAVAVESVAVDGPGWLVVHPAANGGPDAATYLAAVPLDPGRSTDLTVALERSLERDQTLYAMLHYDDPGDDSFTFAPGRGDDPPVAVDGEGVVESFRVTVA